MKDAINFLDRIEGHGYGGMADYEIARTTVRDAEAEIERLRARMEAARAILEKDDGRGESSLGWCIGLCLKAKLKAALFGDGQSPK